MGRKPNQTFRSKEAMKVKSTQSGPTLCDPRTIESMGFSRPESWSEWPFPSPGDLPNPGIEPRSPVLQADSLPPDPPGKPQNTGAGSLSLLQWIFPTQESNRGLLHCSRIIYQLSHQGSPNEDTQVVNRNVKRCPSYTLIRNWAQKYDKVAPHTGTSGCCQKNQQAINAGEGLEKGELSRTLLV